MRSRRSSTGCWRRRAYGERWGRHWLDVARYSDDSLQPDRDSGRLSERYPLSRLGDPGLQRGHAVQRVRQGADRRRSDAVRTIRMSMRPAGFLRAESGDAGRPGGCHHARVSRPDRRLRAVPRPQVRPDSDQGLLLAAGRIRQYAGPRVSARAKDVVERGRRRRRRSRNSSRSSTEFYEQQREQLARILASRTARYCWPARVDSKDRPRRGNAGAMGEVPERTKKKSSFP